MPIAVQGEVMESSSTCVRAGLIALFSVLVHGCGVVPLVSDQAQVDPSVQSNRSYNLGRSQPTPVIPDCEVQQWIERAVSGGAIHCRRSIDGLSKVDAIAASSGRTRRHGQASIDEDAAGSRFQLKRVEAGTLAGEQGARSIRSQVQAELMTYGDLICDKHLAGIYRNQSGLNFDLGLGTALLSGGAAIAEPATGREAQAA